MNILIQEYFKLQAEIKKLEEKKEHLRVKLKTELMKQGVESYEDPTGNLVTFKTMVTNRFNKAKALKLIGEQKLNDCYAEVSAKSLRVYSADQRRKVEE